MTESEIVIQEEITHPHMQLRENDTVEIWHDWKVSDTYRVVAKNNGITRKASIALMSSSLVEHILCANSHGDQETSKFYLVQFGSDKCGRLTTSLLSRSVRIYLKSRAET